MDATQVKKEKRISKSSSVCLLITGCISPNINVPFLSLTDAEERKRQYVDSISFFLNHSSCQKIIYCDSSNYEPIKELTELAKKNKKDFEWLCFQGDTDSAVQYGKGYAEGELIRFALEKSEMLKNCRAFIKITGRLKLLNIRTIFLLAHGKHSYFEIHEDYADTRCYIVQKEDYCRYFLNAYQAVNDSEGRYLEHIAKDIIVQNPLVFYPIPFSPYIVGQSGTVGTWYDSSIRHHIKENRIRLKYAVKWELKHFLKIK